jgi:hypothetical protein
VVSGSCKPYLERKDLLLIFRSSFGVCIGDTEAEERIGTLPFSTKSWGRIKDKLALPDHFLDYMIKKGSPTFKVSTPGQSGRSVTCKFSSIPKRV